MTFIFGGIVSRSEAVGSIRPMKAVPRPVPRRINFYQVKTRSAHLS